MANNKWPHCKGCPQWEKYPACGPCPGCAKTQKVKGQNLMDYDPKLDLPETPPIHVDLCESVDIERSEMEMFLDDVELWRESLEG